VLSYYNTQVLSEARAPCIVAAYGQGGGGGGAAAAAADGEAEQELPLSTHMCEGNSTARSTTRASNTRSKYRSIRKGAFSAFSDAAAPVWVSTAEAPLSRLEI
jgi:hypothetical protein